MHSEYLDKPKRTEAEASLGLLLASIEDARTNLRVRKDEPPLVFAGYVVTEMENIIRAYDRYCEARLREGDKAVVTQNESGE